MPVKKDVVCKNCGSNEIIVDMDGHWDIETQEFIAGDVWEKGARCPACENSDARWDFIEIKE